MIGSECIRVKIRVCLPTQSILRQSPEPAVQLSVKRRYSQSSTPDLHAPFSTSCPIASEYEDLFVRKQFVIFASPLERLFDVKVTVQTMYHKLYPEENPLDIKRLRDSHNCDLDDDFMVGDVFSGGEDAILMAICEFGVILSASSGPSECKRFKEDNDIKHPLPVRPTTNDRCIATPLSTVDELIRVEAEPLFADPIKDNNDVNTAGKMLESSSEEDDTDSESETDNDSSEYETDSEEEVEPATTEKLPDPPKQPVVPSVNKEDSESSEYETDSEAEDSDSEENEKTSPTTTDVVVQPATTKFESEESEYETDSDESEESGDEQQGLVFEKPGNTSVSIPTPSVIVASATKESSSEYESDSGSEYTTNEDDTNVPPVGPEVLPKKEQPNIQYDESESESSSTSSEESDFKPTTLSEVAKRVSVSSSQPQVTLSQAQNKKYGSHLFSQK